MIWLVWHRYRVTVGATIAAVVVLGLAMAWVVHEVNATRPVPCPGGVGRCYAEPHHFIAMNLQVIVLVAILVALPCALGVIFGAPLVASELEHRSNRLVWTQGISRTRWLLTKWTLVLSALGVLVAALTVESQWWTTNVPPSALVNLVSFSFASGGRISPAFFPITGVVAVAYLFFAFGLASVAGAVVRRTGWAIFASVVLYAGTAAVMVLFVRPNLLPQVFVPSGTTATRTASGGFVQFSDTFAVPGDSWDLGFAYRYTPGSREIGDESAASVGQKCEGPLKAGQTYFSCLTSHHVQSGTLYQPSNRYWQLQWREAAILIAASVLCLGGTVVAVRRWQS